MAKQAIPLNFGKGLDTKTDPFQSQIGSFSLLQNSVFDKGGRLTKRNGFGSLPSLPDSNSTFVSTFGGGLTALGPNLQAYSASSGNWSNKGSIQPLELSTLPLVRNSVNQVQSDSAIASNGLICTVYTETDGSTNAFKYVIADSATGQNIIAPTAITQADANLGAPRVFLMGNYFVVVFTNIVTATYHLKFFTISVSNPSIATAPADISTSYTPSSGMAFDAVVLNGALYVAWNGAAASGIKMAIVYSNFSVSSTVIRDASHEATRVSVCADITTQAIWVSYYNSATTAGYALAVDTQLALLSGFPVQIIATGTIPSLISAATAGVVTVFYEVNNTATGVQTNFINSRTVTQSSAAVSSIVTIARSVGIASKAFFVDGSIYLLSAYYSLYQPTYFLLRSNGRVITRLAYENAALSGGGGAYVPYGIPSVSVSGLTASVSYLFKDQIQAVNKNTNVPAGSQTAGVYAQSGINMVSFIVGTSNISTAEIGQNLNISGGFMWAYDGYEPVEQGFFLYPDPVQSTATATTGGHLKNQVYYYQVTYEWSDNQGNLFRSAPSIPISRDISGSGTTTNTITLVIPTLRLTYKTTNAVKIVVYRWSTDQQTYYQVTSISSPTLNSTTTDSVTFVDTLADATILGNNILYTNGGVVENAAAPAPSAITLFDDRLWAIDAEDPNLLSFSKQVIQATPVEMSDLFTFYVAPTIGAQGSTGPMKCISTMDDKLIVFKSGAIYYINGTGPDNTGSNNQYSQPVFITSSVGCSNQRSIVLSPQGLMFQSDKGIWLLGRDLSTKYIGAPVEAFNGSMVQSALSVPETNQVRFTLDTGETLVYDYYYEQWGTFVGAPAVSSTIFQGLHTLINQYGQVLQETPVVYLDGDSPVLIGFTTGWFNFAGIRGYERIHEFSFLGTYFSPHKLAIQVAYDYGNPDHQSLYSPPNYGAPYGGDTLYGGGSPYGGPSNIEQFRVFAKKQKCKSFQVSVQEIYDPSLGVVAGAGLSLSGMNFVVTLKKGSSPITARQSVG